MLWLILSLFIGMSLLMAVGWAYQDAKHNGGWTDVCWTFAMGLVGVAAALTPETGGLHLRQVIVALMVGAWSLRLGLHIRARVLTSPEDARYAEFRESWAPHYRAMMFGFLQVQALAGGLLLIAVLVAARNPAPGLSPQDILGVAVMALALFGEGIADAQLRAFAHDPANKGKVCDAGLWAWSRHPNYFFEWFGWLAYPLIGIEASGVYLWGWAAFLAPAAMYGLLRYGSGVPPLEAHMLRSRGEAFRAYQARVSVFFPLPPKPNPLHHGNQPS
jgi:steroid 5-alpha reductase family enzyme